MLKLAVIGVWVILVTAGATFTSVLLSSSGGDSGERKPDMGIENLSTEMMSIPVIRDGDVTGYMVVQLSFAADRAVLEEDKFDPLPFLKDAAFRTMFSDPGMDVRHLRKKDLDTLTAAIAQEANRRLGMEVILNVLFQEINYVRKDDIRNNRASNG